MNALNLFQRLGLFTYLDSRLPSDSVVFISYFLCDLFSLLFRLLLPLVAGSPDPFISFTAKWKRLYFQFLPIYVALVKWGKNKAKSNRKRHLDRFQEENSVCKHHSSNCFRQEPTSVTASLRKNRVYTASKQVAQDIWSLQGDQQSLFGEEPWHTPPELNHQRGHQQRGTDRYGSGAS